MSKVAVFGSFVVDLMARSPHLPVPGETVKGSMFKMGPGGKGFNQCVAAHKAGADVIMMTKLGRDSFANVALDTMTELGMDKDHIFFSDDKETGIALILVDENTSQNEIIIVPGACNTITKEEIESIESVIKESEYVLLQLEVNQDANEMVVDMANRYGCKVIVNTAPYSAITDEFLSKVYMVTPNEVEAEYYTGIPVCSEADAARAADWFHERGIGEVIITMADRGACLSSASGKREFVPAFSVEAVDTTGAGDAFCGGLLAAVSEGKDWKDAVVFASATAALSVQKIGTAPSMPDRREIEAFLENY